MRRAGVLAALVAGAVMAGGAATALGHSIVVSTAPRDGASLKAAPRAVVVTYSGPLAAAVEATVRAPGGSPRAVKPRLDARNASRVVIPVRGRAPGRYRASWIALGTDGHELTGRTTFVVRAPTIAAEMTMLAAALRRVALALAAAREAAAAQR